MAADHTRDDMRVALKRLADVRDESLYVAFRSDKDVKDFAEEEKEKKKSQQIKHLHMASTLEDPVYCFWLLHDAKVLSDGCTVVMPFPKTSTSDLTKLYGGLKFGNVFLMVYSTTTKPGVCPSQKGMYMK